MAKEQILKSKTRRELAALIGIAYMNETGKDKEAGKRVMKGWLNGAGAVKPSTKAEMIRKLLADESRGFIKIA